MSRVTLDSKLQRAAESYSKNESVQRDFAAGANYLKGQILPDFKFLLQALPNEHRISDLQLRAEIDLVRSKLNEIIAKIQ